jgi:Dolichyl-phosphate-mannose-protein mannosyltransferase
MPRSDSAGPSRTAARSGRSVESLVVEIAVIAFVVYLPALWTGFTSDDFFILARLKHFGALADPWSYFTVGFFDYYRPIAFLSHALDLELWGLAAAGFHLTGMLLHAANSVLVFLLARRMIDVTGAHVAGLLFAVHPASHEVVYWMAARFDLLATFFGLLAIVCLRHDRASWRVPGIIAFALALLSKESAISVLLIVPAYDVIVGRHDWRAVLKRLAPLVGVALAYAVLRNQSADLEAAGGAGKLPKAMALGLALAGLLVLAGRPQLIARLAARRLSWGGIALAVVLLLAALLWPATTAGAREKLGFAAFAAFYSISPVVLPPPSPIFFEPPTSAHALVGLAVIVVGLIALRFAGPALRGARVMFLLAFVVAALIPVSSMTGGPRYLYLPFAGIACLAATIARTWPPLVQSRAVLALGAVLLVSWVQIAMAGHEWRRASRMTSNGLALMSANLEPCGRKDVILLTAPVGIRGVYTNFLWDAFDATTDCPPAQLLTLLRVVRLDAGVEALASPGDVIQLRVPRYAGQFVASADLNTFDRPVPRASRWTLDTPIGRLETQPEESSPDGPVQVFRITLNDRGREAGIFYYSDGAVRRIH